MLVVPATVKALRIGAMRRGGQHLEHITQNCQTTQSNLS